MLAKIFIGLNILVACAHAIETVILVKKKEKKKSEIIMEMIMTISFILLALNIYCYLEY